MNKWKIVAALLAAGWSYDTVIAFVNKNRFKKNLELMERKDLLIDVEQEINNYYATILDRNQVQMTTFDVLAINAITDKLK